jgi:hypothetical protein
MWKENLQDRVAIPNEYFDLKHQVRVKLKAKTKRVDGRASHPSSSRIRARGSLPD